MSKCSQLLVAAALVMSLPAVAAGACEPQNLSFAAPAVGWKPRPLSKLKNDTRYQQADGNSGIRFECAGQ